MTIQERIQTAREERMRRQDFLNKLNIVPQNRWDAETFLKSAELQEEIDELNLKIEELAAL